MRILVAEDEPVSRRLLVATLERLGHEVVITENGLEAWGAFQAAPCPVVVSDWMMPELDGLELCRRIRSLDRSSYTYVILLTALGGLERRVQGMEAGADDFLTKPLDAIELKIRLRVAARVVGLQAEVKQLQELLPICAYCKKIRDERNTWLGLEAYIARRTRASFSHGICPECKQRVLQERRQRPPGTP